MKAWNHIKERQKKGFTFGKTWSTDVFYAWLKKLKRRKRRRERNELD